MTPLFFALSHAKLLRVTDTEQTLGLDTTVHGGPAYTDWDVDTNTAGATNNAIAPGPSVKKPDPHAV
jgi:hypothetical protein